MCAEKKCLLRMLFLRSTSFYKQHDDNFKSPYPGDGPSDNPNEEFFIEKLGPDLRLTGRQLRIKEDTVFRNNRFSLDPDHENYYARDFQFLCRGLDLVTRKPHLSPYRPFHNFIKALKIGRSTNFA